MILPTTKWTHTTKKGTDVKFEIGIADEGGWFELWDDATGGQMLYQHGELEYTLIDGKPTVTGYDGVFELSPVIIAKLRELNIAVDL